ncbi:MAG: N-acetylmuramoyl-L-alanine amidase [Rhodobacter sp.]|nr:N-acetylmuramoyl-L-alanine amidase [Rhodobacter sp.]MBK8441066.1 N-acetylmuramoyl-L-alanine amidase [Rhodobacter sp.]
MRAVLATALVIWALCGTVAMAQELSALARLNAADSRIAADAQGLAVELAISQPVPWRVRVLDGPPRLVLDVREVDWAGLDKVARAAPQVVDARAGVFRAGWSRLVLELAGPYLVASSEMQTGAGGAMIRLKLSPAPQSEFAAAAALPEPADWALPKPADLPPAPVQGTGAVVVVLDPGHGGIDPGAENGDQTEAALMLIFARELKEALVRDGRFSVVMTRDDDVFVPLETRISVARAAGASVFLSLHADALAEGEAQGATIYTLSDDATDEAAQALAERHDRDDLLAGLDLSGQDELVVTILMDMARTETLPRTDRLATALEGAIKDAKLRMHRHPRQQAGFSVLKSPDIPSVLLEVGFLSSSRDLKRLGDADWRAKMVAALVAGLAAWDEEDAAIRAVKDN